MTTLQKIKRQARHSGFALVCIGAVALSAGYALGWTDSNAFLLSAAAAVITGAVLHVYFAKKDSKY